MKKLCARTLTDQEMTHKQDVYKKYRCSPQVACACTTSTRRLEPHRLCWVVGRCHSHATKNTRQPSATVAHVACSSRPTNSYRSIHVFLSQPFATSRSRSTLSVGSRATLRHVPIVLIPQALVVVSHTETVPPFQILRCLQRFRESICCSSIQLQSMPLAPITCHDRRTRPHSELYFGLMGRDQS